MSLAKKLDEDITKLLDDNANLSVTKAAVFCAMAVSYTHLSMGTVGFVLGASFAILGMVMFKGLDDPQDKK